jgi:hypothetical protein
LQLEWSAHAPPPPFGTTRPALPQGRGQLAVLFERSQRPSLILTLSLAILAATLDPL